MNEVSEYDQIIEEHFVGLGLSDLDLYGMYCEFVKNGVVSVTRLFPGALVDKVKREAGTLLDMYGIRRDFVMKVTGDTPRKMTNVSQAIAAEHGRIIPTLYKSGKLREILSFITRETVHVCPYPGEQYVITRLEQSGDTHGGHWDDFSFALVWILQCPHPRYGGYVQTVPHTVWNKADHEIWPVFKSNAIHTHIFLEGDLYLLRSDTTLHRVHPLSDGHSRVIVNMGWASNIDLNRQISHETVEALWSPTSIERIADNNT